MEIMMAYNIKSTIAFAAPRGNSPDWGLNGEGATVLEPLLLQLIDTGKTDGRFYTIDDCIGYRLFSDQASAESWQAALSQCITDIGHRTDFTTSIETI